MCEHEDFVASVEVFRLKKGEEGPVYAHTCEIHVNCKDCGLPFEFPEIPPGMNHKEMRVSLDAQTLRLPIKPKGTKVFPAVIGFEVRCH